MKLRIKFHILIHPNPENPQNINLPPTGPKNGTKFPANSQIKPKDNLSKFGIMKVIFIHILIKIWPY
jgi:hypothetical protein